MSENYEFETLDQPEEVIEDRRRLPVFLKTIAILTFIGSFFRIIGSVITLVAMGFLNNIAPGMGKKMDSDFNDVYSWTIIFSYVAILNSLLCTTGAILMIKRKVSGYWIYIFAQIFFIAATLLTTFATSGTYLGASEMISGFVNCIVAIGFCVMYTLNKKHLGKINSRSEVNI